MGYWVFEKASYSVGDFETPRELNRRTTKSASFLARYNWAWLGLLGVRGGGCDEHKASG